MAAARQSTTELFKYVRGHPLMPALAALLIDAEQNPLPALPIELAREVESFDTQESPEVRFQSIRKQIEIIVQYDPASGKVDVSSISAYFRREWTKLARAYEMYAGRIRVAMKGLGQLRPVAPSEKPWRLARTKANFNAAFTALEDRTKALLLNAYGRLESPTHATSHDESSTTALTPASRAAAAVSNLSLHSPSRRQLGAARRRRAERGNASAHPLTPLKPLSRAEEGSVGEHTPLSSGAYDLPSPSKRLRLQLRLDACAPLDGSGGGDNEGSGDSGGDGSGGGITNSATAAAAAAAAAAIVTGSDGSGGEVTPPTTGSLGTGFFGRFGGEQLSSAGDLAALQDTLSLDATDAVSLLDQALRGGGSNSSGSSAGQTVPPSEGLFAEMEQLGPLLRLVNPPASVRAASDAHEGPSGDGTAAVEDEELL